MTPPAPLRDGPAMVAWFAALSPETQRKMTKGLVARLAEIRTEIARDTGKTLTDPAYEKFTASRAGKHPSDVEAITELKRLRDFAIFKISAATEIMDFTALNSAKALLRELSAIIHDEEIRGQRLGREMGDILPRPQAEAIAGALGFWLMRGADELIAELQPKLVAASAAGALGYEQIRKIIEPSVLSKRVLVPFVRSMKNETGMTLPKWMVEAMGASMDDALEDGVAEVTKLLGETKT